MRVRASGYEAEVLDEEENPGERTVEVNASCPSLRLTENVKTSRREAIAQQPVAITGSERAFR